MELKLRSRRQSSLLDTPFNCTSWNWNVTTDTPWRINWAFNCTSWNWNCIILIMIQIIKFLLIVLHGIETRLELCSNQFCNAFNCTSWNWNNISQNACIFFLSFNCTTTHRIFDTDGLQRVVHIYYDKDKWNPESRLNNWIRIRSYESKALACVCKLEKDRIVFKSWY